jgi:DHA2 family multidrug resistance protein
MSLEPSTAYPSGLRLILITIALTLAPLLQVLDSSIMSIALKQMQGSLSATQDQVAWVLTSYLIAVAVLTPFWGAMSGRFGRKPLLLISITGMVIFSILSGTSTTLTEILIYRFAQGMFGAALIPLAQSSLLSMYPREDFGTAMSWWGVGVMVGPIFGPTLGGYITEFYSWRWAFYLNVPVGITAFTMIALWVPRPGTRNRRPFNYIGYSMLAIAVAALVFVLDRGERLDWFSSSTITVLSAISAAALWVFMVNSFTSKTPFVDPAIFSDRNYVTGIILRVMFGAMLFGSLVLMPPFIQNQGGYSLVDSGVIMAPRGFGAMVAAYFTGRLMKLVDPRLVIAVGMSVAAVTMWEFSKFTSDIEMSRIVLINFIQGMAFSFFIIPVNAIAFSTMATAQRDMGTAFYSLMNNIGRSLGIAALASFLARNTQANHAVLAEFISPYNEALRHVPLPDALNWADPRGLAALDRLITQQAELIAYSADFQALAVAIAICIPALMLMNNPFRQKQDPAVESAGQ